MLKLSVDVLNPLITIPQKPSENNFITLDLGRTRVDNTLFELSAAHPVLNRLGITVNNLRLSQVSSSSSCDLVTCKNITADIVVPLAQREKVFPSVVGSVRLPIVSSSFNKDAIIFLLDLVKENFTSVTSMLEFAVMN